MIESFFHLTFTKHFLSVNHIYDYLKLLGLITFKHILGLPLTLRVFSRPKQSADCNNFMHIYIFIMITFT